VIHLGFSSGCHVADFSEAILNGLVQGKIPAKPHDLKMGKYLWFPVKIFPSTNPLIFRKVISCLFSRAEGLKQQSYPLVI